MLIYLIMVMRLVTSVWYRRMATGMFGLAVFGKMSDRLLDHKDRKVFKASKVHRVHKDYKVSKVSKVHRAMKVHKVLKEIRVTREIRETPDQKQHCLTLFVIYSTEEPPHHMLGPIERHNPDMFCGWMEQIRNLQTQVIGSSVILFSTPVRGYSYGY